MKYTIVSLLFLCCSAFASASYYNEIIFYNQSNTDVRVDLDGVTGGLLSCNDAPYSYCVKPGENAILKPKTYKIFTLQSQMSVNNQLAAYGNVMFDVDTPNGSNNGINRVFVPVVVRPHAVIIQKIDRSGFGNAITDSYAENTLPQYTLSLTQQWNLSHDAPVVKDYKTIVVINGLKLPPSIS